MDSNSSKSIKKKLDEKIKLLKQQKKKYGSPIKDSTQIYGSL